ncbi:MAG: hypothetical protein GC150_11350 [Rhizobiales bacterium]|nr:hypothetical protein [Hyphomicrobiales bacterium]
MADVTGVGEDALRPAMGAGRKLALFIHGFDSSPAIWDALAGHLAADDAITAAYDFARFQYATGKLPGASLATPGAIAETLATALTTTYADYTEIALIAHSQGGPIAMRALCNLLAANQGVAVTRLLTYASPILGTAMASNPLAAMHPQLAALATDSDFLMAVNRDAERLGLAGHVHIRHVAASRDRWVSRTSAIAGEFAAHPETVEGDHVEIVRPASADDPASLIARRFLLDPPPPPGAGDVDRTAPILRANTWDLTEANRFVYGARKVPFYGREKEIAALAEFCSGEAPLAWVLVHGAGGTGKSRLALELILGLRKAGVHAGFLPAAGDGTAQPDWARWQPLFPTVMVVDYAARESAAVAGMLKALAARRADEGVGALGAPVRVILIEQAAGGDWLDRVMPAGNSGVGVKGAFAGPLALAPIDDVGPIFEAYLGKERVAEFGFDKLEARLTETDPERRPLFAALLADALDANWAEIEAGKPVAAITDRARLLSETLRRWRENHWRPAGATRKDERLLAVATMAGGLTVGEVDALAGPGGRLAKLIAPWDVDGHPAAFTVMTGRPSGEGPGRLEPDIVGEYHALEVLADGKLTDADRAGLRDAAWAAAPRQMFDFVMRCHRNWPGEAATTGLREAPALPTDDFGLAEWASLGVGLTYETFGKGRRLLANADAGQFLASVRAVAEARAGEPSVEAIWTEWAGGGEQPPPRARGAARDPRRGAGAAQGPVASRRGAGGRGGRRGDLDRVGEGGVQSPLRPQSGARDPRRGTPPAPGPLRRRRGAGGRAGRRGDLDRVGEGGVQPRHYLRGETRRGGHARAPARDRRGGAGADRGRGDDGGRDDRCLRSLPPRHALPHRRQRGRGGRPRLRRPRGDEWRRAPRDRGCGGVSDLDPPRERGGDGCASENLAARATGARSRGRKGRDDGGEGA